MNMRSLRLASVVAILGLAVSCASTQVTSSWTSPGIANANVRKVVVVAMVPQEVNRRNMEANLAADLQKRGIQAVQSNQLIQNGSELQPDRVKQIVQSNNFDAVLVTQYMGTQREYQYVPGTYGDYFGY